MTAKKVLVTGGGQGFVAAKLVQQLRHLGHLVYDDFFDITQPDLVAQVIRDNNYDFVFHMAAISHNVICEENPSQSYLVNSIGTKYLVDALLEYSPDTCLVFPSTAYVYDFSKIDIDELNCMGANYKGIDENFFLNPKTVYAKSKLLSEDIITKSFDRYGLKSMILRLFNHTHRTQDKSFFLPSILTQLLDTKTESVLVGSVDVYRDFSLVGDLVLALCKVIYLDPACFNSQIFNVSSGCMYRLADIIEEMKKQLNSKYHISDKPLKIDKNRIRTDDPKYIYGNSNKFSTLIGDYRPIRTCEQFVREFLAEG